MNEQILNDLKQEKETFLLNENLTHTEPMSEIGGKKFVYVKAAQNRLMRFMPYIRKAFPETEQRLGIIESELWAIPDMRDFYEKKGISVPGNLLLKDDAHLPISGSVKARGGIYEVLKHAEDLAVREGLISPADDHAVFDSKEFHDFFSNYTIQVGSTGNLGLSIGLMGSALGFHVTVHMSKDAKAWKKDKLRSLGVTVLEYDSDYTKAVEEGRKASESDPDSYFIDDENSQDLFMGYATAALRLKVQLFKAKIPVTADHPLFVYLPCGVGGAPGGISYGLKQMYGDNVHCFFIEPVKAPCFLAGMLLGKPVPVSDYGLEPSQTIADGLAVGRASSYSLDICRNILSGCMTVEDRKLKEYQQEIFKEGIYLEPSACAGFIGPEMLLSTDAGREYLDRQGLTGKMEQASHLIWATGGGLVPESEKEF